MTTLIQVDTREMRWPRPMKALQRALRKARGGDVIELLATDPAIESVAKAWCGSDRRRGYRLDHDPTGVHVVTITIADGPAEPGEAALETTVV